MRGWVGRTRLRLLVYALSLLLVMALATSAYASPEAAVRTTPVLRHVATTPRLPPTPAPSASVTTVLSPSAFDQLTSDLQSIAAGSGGRVGISLQELSGPRRTSLSLNGDQSFSAASTYKLPLLMAEAQQIAAGQASPSDVLCFDPSDYEDGWFTDYVDTTSCFTREELAIRAGRYSDNTAAHILVRYLGGADVLNAYAKTIGMTNSALWIPNDTTPDDLTHAWVSAALGGLGGSAAQQWLYQILTHTTSEQGIPAGVPATVSVAHKVGNYGTVLDAGFVQGGRIAYVLSVAVDGLDEGAGWAVIAQVSARVWKYESSRPDYVAPVIATAVVTPLPNHH